MVNPNGSIDPSGDTFWADIEKIVDKREAIADELINVLAGHGLTVSTAKDVIFRASSRIEEAVKVCPVAALSTDRISLKDVRKL